jgi:hypothetical protein
MGKLIMEKLKNLLKLISNTFQSDQKPEIIQPIKPVVETGSNTSIALTPNKKWEYIVIHHSATPDSKAKDWDAIKHYHTSYRFNGAIITKEQYDYYVSIGKAGDLQKPWKDIGYHFGLGYVDGKLKVLEGRPLSESGEHTSMPGCTTFNDHGIGICLIGSYDYKEPNEEQINALLDLVVSLIKRFNISIDKVIGHREVYDLLKKPRMKSCPGSKLNMIDFRRRLHDRGIH